jgi:hypothetical protein
VALVALGSVLLSPRSTSANVHSIQSPDTAGDVGDYTSLELDPLGNPVVSYYDDSNSDLKLLHCNDPSCAGGNESIQSPDTGGSVGQHTSLELDALGNPVVSYYDDTNDDLKLLHCNDPNCAGGGDIVQSPDTAGSVGRYTSLELDSSGNPVAGYTDLSIASLALIHCNDPYCAGGNESIQAPDTEGFVGEYISLRLDAAGNPVVSYHDAANGALKLLHCNDPNCAGGDESVQSPDTAGSAGRYTSLVLDASGNPVVSHRDEAIDDLKLLHCNDPYCAGGNESIQAPDTGGAVGEYTSLALDALGNPVVSYHDFSNGDLKLLHCNDPNCAGGDESIQSPDTLGNVGWRTSLSLDTVGNPVVSYYDFSNGDLKLLHCVNRNCSNDSDADGTPDTDDLNDDGDSCTDAQELAPSPLAGGARNPKSFWDFFDTPDAANVRDAAVTAGDLARVVARFGATGGTGIDPLSAPPAAPAYHTAFDRSSPAPGADPWDAGPPNGSVTVTDIASIVAQFGHSCV